MKCVISVLGKDRSGIVAAVSVALAECGANDGGYYVGFYEKTDHNNGLGGFLFMLEVFPTDYDYTVLPEYQAICGLTVDGANYNLIAEPPTRTPTSTAVCPTTFRPSSRA